MSEAGKSVTHLFQKLPPVRVETGAVSLLEAEMSLIGGKPLIEQVSRVVSKGEKAERREKGKSAGY